MSVNVNYLLYNYKKVGIRRKSVTGDSEADAKLAVWFQQENMPGTEVVAERIGKICCMVFMNRTLVVEGTGV